MNLPDRKNSFDVVVLPKQNKTFEDSSFLLLLGLVAAFVIITIHSDIPVHGSLEYKHA